MQTATATFNDTHFLDLHTLTVVPCDAPAKRAKVAKPVSTRETRGAELVAAVRQVKAGVWSVQGRLPQPYSVVAVRRDGVDALECDCYDALNSGRVCKHQIAVSLTLGRA